MSKRHPNQSMCLHTTTTAIYIYMYVCVYILYMASYYLCTCYIRIGRRQAFFYFISFLVGFSNELPSSIEV